MMECKKQQGFVVFCLFEIFNIKLNLNFEKAKIFCDYLKPIIALEKQSYGGTGCLWSSMPVTNFVEIERRFLATLVVAVSNTGREATTAMAMIVCSRSQ